MESLAYMILTLPHALGGYGLDGAVFNHEIKLQKDARARLEQDRCFISTKKQVSNTKATHTTANHQKWARMPCVHLFFKERESACCTISTIQLYNKDACRDFAYNLAARLGKRISIRTEKFDKMHTVLRDLLPDSKSNGLEQAMDSSG